MFLQVIVVCNLFMCDSLCNIILTSLNKTDALTNKQDSSLKSEQININANSVKETPGVGM